jgi:putative flippase GtrA
MPLPSRGDFAAAPGTYTASIKSAGCRYPCAVTSLLRRGPLASREAFFAWLHELVRFGTVGAVAYTIDAGGWMLLVRGPGHLMGDAPGRASLLTGALSILVAWLGNRYWTFADNRNPAKTKELILFVLVNIAGVLIATAAVYVSRWTLGYTSGVADFVSRNIIGIGLGTVFRYIMYKTVVFRGPGPVNQEQSLPAGVRPAPSEETG